MKKLLLILLGASLAGTASAQTISQTESSVSVPVEESIYSLTQIAKPYQPPSAAPQADNVRLSYYSPTGTQFAWQGPVQDPNNTAIIYLAYGQRFTLPAEAGTVDSVRIQFGQIVQTAAGGQVNILVVRDSLFDFTPDPDFHLPQISEAGLIGSAAVPAAAVAGLQNFTLTINFNGMPVPKEFFVYVAPSFAGTSNSSAFTLISEIQTDVVRSTENSRSVVHFLNAATQSESVSVMDNFFSIDGNQVGVNFAIEAFVQTETGSVDRPSTTPAAMYPNPVSASNMLKIEHNEMISSVRIVNMLGNEVLGWDGMRNVVELSAAGLAKGVYHVIVNTENGMTTEKLIVE